MPDPILLAVATTSTIVAVTFFIAYETTSRRLQRLIRGDAGRAQPQVVYRALGRPGCPHCGHDPNAELNELLSQAGAGPRGGTDQWSGEGGRSQESYLRGAKK